MLNTQEFSPIHYILIGDNFHTPKADTLKQEILDYYTQHDLFTPRYREKFANCGTPITHTIKERCGLAECPLCYGHKVHLERQKLKRKQARLSCLNLLTRMATLNFADVQEQDFSVRYNYLSKQFTRLINSRQCKRLILGTAKTIETSFSDIGLYHVHLHILLAYKDSLDKEELTQLIEKYFPDCRQVHFHPQESPVNLLSFFDYVTKIPDCDVVEWLTLRQASKKKKKVTYTGIFAKPRGSPEQSGNKGKRQNF